MLALAVAAGLSACASVDQVDYNGYLDTASRAAPVEPVLAAPVTTAPLERAQSYKVLAVNVSVPQTLIVSEKNRYYPSGDIVWREDPIGNRHEQVKTIISDALTQGVSNLDGDREVYLDVTVRRFHALTEKARYTVGGVHAIQFHVRLRDAATNEVVMEPKLIKADFDALGGQAAIQAEAAGKTQKVRITQHLAYVIQQELTQPEGYIAQDTGLVGAVNQL
ncbi:putative lipoprotein [Candidatus Rhodobacter oscarellae]|uniref:Putative lipoprotein n=1 Tax=Candidatus Rhodobacter oscarellae TaxID=1675527 RepID=A0A0J9E1E7_9RHOB|nr:putative lipoprotein [Candidatus Rhodobacter lobularis]